nr:unnamed protein product [Digitaria exilis]
MWCILIHLPKNLRLNPLDGDKVLTMLVSQLHKGMVMVGNGSKILGWTTLVTEEFFQLTQYAVAPGSEVVDEGSGKKIGTVNTALGSRGMGLLRLEEALKQGSSLRIGDNRDVRVQAIRPDWWPAEWTQMLDQKSAVA